MKFMDAVVLPVTMLVFSFMAYSAGRSCNLKNPCSCEFDDESGTIDLTSLGNTDDTPRFKDVLNKQGGDYMSYNPCGGFDEGACSDAAVCLLNSDKTDQQLIGSPSNAAFVYNSDTDGVMLVYTSAIEMMSVILVCDQTACDPMFESDGETEPRSFRGQLTTVCACPGMCTASGPTKGCQGGISGISVGSVLLIVFVACFPVYIIGGALFMKFKKKATGTDVIPNKDMWKSLPLLVVSGVKFTFSKCIKRKLSYDSI